MPKCIHCRKEKPVSEFADKNTAYWYVLGCRPCFRGMWFGDGRGSALIHKDNPWLSAYQKKGPATASTVAGPSVAQPYREGERAGGERHHKGGSSDDAENTPA